MANNKNTKSGWMFAFIGIAGLCFTGSMHAVYAQTNETSCQAVIANANAALGGDQDADKTLRRLAVKGNALAQALEAREQAIDQDYFTPLTNRFLERKNAALLYARESAENGSSLGKAEYGYMSMMMSDEYHSVPERKEVLNRAHRYLKEGLEIHRQGPCAGPYLSLLANEYAHGWGVKRDLHKAFRLQMKAAKIGEITGIGGVAAFYSRKKGPFFNPAKAVVWATRAADAGYLPGITLLGHLYASGTGVKQSETKAFNLYKQASDRGYPPAIYYLSLAYFDGRGTSVRREKAVTLMKHDRIYRPALRATLDESWYKNAPVINHYGQSNLSGMWKTPQFRQFEKENGLKPIQFRHSQKFKQEPPHWHYRQSSHPHCPISAFDCHATAAEGGVIHDLPSPAFERRLRQDCLLRGTGLAGLKRDYCGCVAAAMAATPGEWRATRLAHLKLRRFYGRNLAALPPTQATAALPKALSMQIIHQSSACLENAISNRPSGDSARMLRTRLPSPYYTRRVGLRVAHQVRAIRAREERRAMAHDGGEPVALPTGISHVAVRIAPSGQVIDIRKISSPSMELWRIERAAIRKASPFPPPGRRVTVHLATWANDPTPGE